MKTVAVLDTSWNMYCNRHALSELSYRLTLPDGRVAEYPVGHVYGVLNDVYALSKAYNVVIMCVDSIRTERRQLLSTYKAGRHEKTGDPFVDYNVYNDLVNILKLCTYLDNVLYCKAPEYESDDIIAMWIRRTLQPEGQNMLLSAYFNDNDILQNVGRYNWHNRVSGSRPNSRRDYLMEKFKLPLENLPIVWKMVRGDSSDKIPNAIPRFPSKDLIQMAVDLAEVTDFQTIIQYMRDSLEDKTSMHFTATWKERLAPVNDADSDLYKALELNYKVIVPVPPKYEELEFKKLGISPEEAYSLLQHYQLNSLYEKWGFAPPSLPDSSTAQPL